MQIISSNGEIACAVDRHDSILIRKITALMSKANSPLFDSITFPNGFTLRNRIAMAPMTTWSGHADGTVSEEELAYYRRRVKGVGIVITGCSHVTADGIGFTDEFASFGDEFIPSLRRLAEAAKSGGAPAILQIFHAGNKAVAQLTPNGEVVSASAVPVERGPFNEDDVPIRELEHDEIQNIVKAFGEATRRAIEAGFDGVELHGAHGFLIQNFFSPLYNRRTDLWGGSLENRMRFPLAVLQEVKRAAEFHANRPFIVGYRVSPEEHQDGGLRIGDTCELVDELIFAGVDYLHISLPDILGGEPIDGEEGVLAVDIVLQSVGGRVPVMAAGQIENPVQAEAALSCGLSMVAVGRVLVTNPDWVELARSDRTAELDAEIDPETVHDVAIPPKLWRVIQERAGWFKIRHAAPSVS
jgi:2,4-dienoyl-CoA reductase-like NADH-dependent reductase (Old Yellow Enzyme family)